VHFKEVMADDFYDWNFLNVNCEKVTKHFISDSCFNLSSEDSLFYLQHFNESYGKNKIAFSYVKLCVVFPKSIINIRQCQWHVRC